jgi:DNA-dependent metalloprotease WSS1
MSRHRAGTELDPLVTEYQHDQHRYRAPEALHTLRKIASLVKPVMRQRNWRVSVLCEFYPEEPNLLGLNINRGQKICIRLRYPGDERQFLPVEDVVDTMLHELCHNVHGPHDEPFHALWNQLRDEHEALVRKGYTGEGFLSEGKKLGGSGYLPMHEARRRARAAAEKRKALTVGSGQKLGGAPVMRGTDIRKVIADAAQRRITVTKGCASGTDQGRKIARDVEENRNGFRTKAEEDDANERVIMQAYIDLIHEEEKEKYGDGYVPPSEKNPAGSRATMSPIPTLQSPSIPVETKLVPQNEPQPPSIDLTYEEDADTWTCDVCTLVNPIQFLACDACTAERPSTMPTAPARSGSTNSKKPEDRQKPNALKPRQSVAKSLATLEAQEASKPAKPMGWLCHVCNNWMESQWWTCARCGSMKQVS